MKLKSKKQEDKFILVSIIIIIISLCFVVYDNYIAVPEDFSEEYAMETMANLDVNYDNNTKEYKVSKYLYNVYRESIKNSGNINNSKYKDFISKEDYQLLWNMMRDKDLDNIMKENGYKLVSRKCKIGVPKCIYIKKGTAIIYMAVWTSRTWVRNDEKTSEDGYGGESDFRVEVDVDSNKIRLTDTYSRAGIIHDDYAYVEESYDLD